MYSYTKSSLVGERAPTLDALRKRLTRHGLRDHIGTGAESETFLLGLHYFDIRILLSSESVDFDPLVISTR